MGKLLAALVVILGVAAPAGAREVTEYTYEEMTEPRLSHEGAMGIGIGAFMAAPFSCPSTVTAKVIDAHMVGRIARGANKATDSWLVVFYGAAADAGCKAWTIVPDAPAQQTRKPNL